MDLAIFQISTSKLELPGTVTISFSELIKIAKSKAILGHIYRYRDVSFYTVHFNSFARPFFAALLCRLLARRRCRWIDQDGKTQNIGFSWVCHEAARFFRELLSCKAALALIRGELTELEKTISDEQPDFDISRAPVYLRTDFTAGFIAGGSVGHIAGVINNLSVYFEEKPVFISMDSVPTIQPDIEMRLIKDGPRYLNIPQLSSIFFSNVFYNHAKNILKDKRISMLYQRSALNSYAGVKLADELRVPFVLEYNGSEVWVAEKWGGKKLKTLDISTKIEELTFKKADLIVCVSKPLQDELLTRGIDRSKILVNPNGVDETVYHPLVKGDRVRNKFKINQDEKIIGFIGTFGPWHGAEILAQAFAGLVRSGIEARLFMIGDGLRMPEVRKILADNNILEKCIFAGLIPQKEGPEYLAACDILVSPQVPNIDGTPFFGSPTKLFEYMAMGKAIAASNLDQIGEVLNHEKTALLCRPGDAESLGDVLLRLINDKSLCQTLGENARREVLDKYTWKLHTKRIIDALRKRYKGAIT